MEEGGECRGKSWQCDRERRANEMKGGREIKKGEQSKKVKEERREKEGDVQSCSGLS